MLRTEGENTLKKQMCECSKAKVSFKEYYS